MNRKPQLLVSVRSVVEAAAALEGGAHLIDVKEPLHGSLGRAGDAVIAAVIECVAGQRPVSAALGELANSAELTAYPGPGLAYAKWGLFGMGNRPDWRQSWWTACRRMAEANALCRVVLVSYADWQWAGAPSVAEVSAFAREQPRSVLLVDTFQKAPRLETGLVPTLLDLLPLSEIIDLCRSCQEAGVRVALAGSLGAMQIARLSLACPDWFAVRGAVCEGGRREAVVSARKVRELVELLE